MDVSAATDETAIQKPREHRRGWLVASLFCWAYLVSIAGLIYFLRTRGDSGGIATVLLFSPRWVFAAPLIVCLPLLIYRSCWIPVLLIVLTALFPLMGLCTGWHQWIAKSPVGQSLRIITFNMHLSQTDAPEMVQFLSANHPDVVVLEEIPDKIERKDLPADLTHIVRRGELFVASKYPIVGIAEVWDYSGYRYTLKTPAGLIDFIGVHLGSPHLALRDAIEGRPEGRQELQSNIARREEEAAELRRQIDESKDKPLIIAGDFNLVSDSPVFTANFSSVHDAFETAGIGFGWTYFHQHTMVRIDHVLTNQFFQTQTCKVGPQLVSPHRPLIADVVLLR